MMSAGTSRVKILCVRAQPNPDCATLLHSVVDEWVHALALHCDIEVIEQDFDLREVYERVKPDFLLFDSIHWGRKYRLTISNLDAYPDLPRALLLNNDPHEPMRPLTMDLMAAYGIDTVFCTGTEDLEHMHELRRFNAFVLPKFIDSDVFHDYGEERSIPVTIMSAHLFPTFYPWRARVTEEIQNLMPTLLYTHPGYTNARHDPFAIRDEKYARMLSRSQFCIADTTRLDYVVRKHLEIPAAGSVLVSPPSEALREYGFIDMENCVLGAAGAELYGKILAVANDPLWYERIRSNGHALVHSRYTRQHWTHILDWFACRRACKPGQKVQQDGVLGKFRIVEDEQGVLAIADWVVRDSPMAIKLRAARDALLHDGDLQAAVDGLNETMEWIGHIAEPWFLMGVIAFSVGDLDNAAQWLAKRSAIQGREDSALGILDPCEIAWLLLFAHLTGDEELYQQMSDSADRTSHLSIRRMRWLIDGANADLDIKEAGLDAPREGDCLSIHWLGDEDFEAWFGLIQKVLIANEQMAAARVA